MVTCHSHDQLSPSLRSAICVYRRRVFVDWMGWQLPMPFGFELDEFDNSETVHVMAHDEAGDLVGYCRLLPTTSRYLLQSHFPQLLGSCAAPSDASVWELSRYAAVNTKTSERVGFGTDERVGKALLLTAIEHAAAAGASSLVYCSTLAIERLARRWGVEALRLAPPLKTADGWLVAGQILFSSTTRAALRGAPSEACVERWQGHPNPIACGGHLGVRALVCP